MLGGASLEINVIWIIIHYYLNVMVDVTCWPSSDDDNTET